MKRFAVPKILLVFGLLVGSGPGAIAESDLTSQAVDLVGVWESINMEAHGWRDERWDHTMGQARLTIKEQTGSIVTGTWATSFSAPVHDGKDFVPQREYDLVGVVSWSGDEITLVNVKQKDAIVYNGRIVNPYTIEMIGHEAGEKGWVAKHLLVRR